MLIFRKKEKKFINKLELRMPIMGKKRVGKRKSLSRATSKLNLSKKSRKSGFWLKLAGILAPKNAPLGIKVLGIYSSFILLIYLICFFAGMDFPLTVFFSKIIQGTDAFMINLAFIALLASFIYGMVKRRQWAYYMGLLWFVFTSINSIVSVLTVNEPLLAIMQQLKTISLISVLLINGIVIWYLVAERKWFLQKRIELKPVRAQDKIFVAVIIIFWIAALIIGLIFGAIMFSDAKVKVNSMMATMIAKEYNEAIDYCNSKTAEDKDICYTVLATIKYIDTRNDIAQLCGNVESAFYKFTCYRAAS